MLKTITVFTLATTLLATLIIAADDDTAEKPEAKTEGKVTVGRLIYAGGKTSKCFAEGFLELADRYMESEVEREFKGIKLEDEKIYDYPFMVMTGEGPFKLSDQEKENMKSYLTRGGFLLASAGCSNKSWSDSFKASMEDLFEDVQFKELDTKHPLFHTLYDVDKIEAARGQAKGALYGLTINGRLAAVFSPLGLNDTGNAGGGCCCCGGNEVRNAKEINANILAYALTH